MQRLDALTASAHIPCDTESQERQADESDGSCQGAPPKHARDNDDGEQDRQEHESRDGAPDQQLSDGVHDGKGREPGQSTGDSARKAVNPPFELGQHTGRCVIADRRWFVAHND
jgi:hypothetical protein